MRQNDNSAGMLAVTGSGAMYEYSCEEIPWAEYRDLITGVSLDYGVTSLSAWAFAGITELAEITVPEGVTAAVSTRPSRRTSIAARTGTALGNSIPAIESALSSLRAAAPSLKGGSPRCR